MARFDYIVVHQVCYLVSRTICLCSSMQGEELIERTYDKSHEFTF